MAKVGFYIALIMLAFTAQIGLGMENARFPFTIVKHEFLPQDPSVTLKQYLQEQDLRVKSTPHFLYQGNLYGIAYSFDEHILILYHATDGYIICTMSFSASFQVLPIENVIEDENIRSIQLLIDYFSGVMLLAIHYSPLTHSEIKILAQHYRHPRFLHRSILHCQRISHACFFLNSSSGQFFYLHSNAPSSATTDLNYYGPIKEKGFRFYLEDNLYLDWRLSKSDKSLDLVQIIQEAPSGDRICLASAPFSIRKSQCRTIQLVQEYIDSENRLFKLRAVIATKPLDNPHASVEKLELHYAYIEFMLSKEGTITFLIDSPLVKTQVLAAPSCSSLVRFIRPLNLSDRSLALSAPWLPVSVEVQKLNQVFIFNIPFHDDNFKVTYYESMYIDWNPTLGKLFYYDERDACISEEYSIFAYARILERLEYHVNSYASIKNESSLSESSHLALLRLKYRWLLDSLSLDQYCKAAEYCGFIRLVGTNAMPNEEKIKDMRELFSSEVAFSVFRQFIQCVARACTPSTLTRHDKGSSG
jgi:hypothetical protein